VAISQAAAADPRRSRRDRLQPRPAASDGPAMGPGSWPWLSGIGA